MARRRPRTGLVMSRWTRPTLADLGRLAIEVRQAEIALRDLRRSFRAACTAGEEDDPHRTTLPPDNPFGDGQEDWHDENACPGCAGFAHTQSTATLSGRCRTPAGVSGLGSIAG